MREVSRALEAGRLKCAVFARKIDASPALDAELNAIVTACEDSSVPVVIALDRSRLAALLHRKARIAAVGVLEIDAVASEWRRLAAAAAEAAAEWALFQHDPLHAALIEGEARRAEEEAKGEEMALEEEEEEEVEEVEEEEEEDSERPSPPPPPPPPPKPNPRAFRFNPNALAFVPAAAAAAAAAASATASASAPRAE
jgi:acylphosphatase